MKITVDNIYPEPCSHQRILHPESGRTVRLMSPRQFVKEAAKMLKAIYHSGCRTIIALESGAAPLAKTCQLLAEKQGFALSWQSLKVWREDSNKYWVGGKLPLSGKSLVLDEYVDSGTVMQNAFSRLKKLGLQSTPGIICYTWLAEKNPLEAFLKYAAYRGRSSFYWEEQGAYPCENRIDLIGYFFPKPEGTSAPLQITDFVSSVSPTAKRKCETFLAKLWKYCFEKNLLVLLQKQSLLKPVQNSFLAAHTLRLTLVELEKAIEQSSACTEFLVQLEDMYGPMWSPYPDSYHLDFQQASKATASGIQKLKNFDRLLENYRRVREPLVQIVAGCCEARRLRWEKQISQIVEEEQWTI